MRVKEILKESASIEPLRLRIDNPAADGSEDGREWLDNEREAAASYGFNDFGAPRVFGCVTGTYNREAFIPIDVLVNIQGARGEQGNVRSSDLDWITNHMYDTGKLPPSDAYPHGEYPPLIAVDQSGTPFVLEGNHRIMAAKKVGFHVLPVTIRYFNGGEQEDGVLSPDKVERYDSTAIAQGYKFGKYRIQKDE